MKKIDYTYKNCPVPGGGFVTGFVFHKTAPDILYCRTDIGGTYRYDFKEEVWKSLIDHCTDDDSSECYPISIALSDNPNDLFIACGDHKTGRLCISHDRGESFEYKAIPCGIHGNMPGRATGERLIFSNGILWFASQTAGLFKSTDMGDSWENINVNNETNLTFVWTDDDGKTIVAGSNGESELFGNMRGNTLYISYNGSNFFPLPIPEAVADERCTLCGFVPQRCVFDGEFLYVTFAQSLNAPIQYAAGFYACDTGTLFDGRVVRYNLAEKTFTDITPPLFSIRDENPKRIRMGGFSGIDCKDGILVVSTVCEGPDKIYMSTDKGNAWFEILSNLNTGRCDFSSVPYMKPCYNGNRSLLHWLSDIKINPHNTDFMVMNSGTGIFCGKGLKLASQKHDSDYMMWTPFTKGIEETVHLNVYSLPEGDVKVIDIIGDLGGFAFTDLDKPCENSFADEKYDRYITCMNADFSDKDAYYIAATPRGNWTGRTKGGIIVTRNQCRTWKLLPYPYGITPKIDSLIDNIQKPNVDSGWVAMTCDKKRILWAIAFMHSYHSDCLVYTDDEGESWKKSAFYNENGEELNDDMKILIYADRAKENVVYAFSENNIFVSTDKGEKFIKTKITGDVPPCFLGSRRACEIRCEPNGSILWAALGEHGLYRLFYENSVIKSLKITKGTDTAKGVGIGKNKVIYTSGRHNGVYGFWRSDDYGESWSLISNDRQHFGTVNSISGDMRTEDRFYIATGSRGLIYGTVDKTKNERK